MNVKALVPQLRTTDLEGAITFYTQVLGFDLAFRYEDFYAGVSAGEFVLHLKLSDTADPSIRFVRGKHLHLHITIDDLDAMFERVKTSDVTIVEEMTERPWGLREFVIEDLDGHTIYFAQEG
ncbi:MAG: hypothetical protein HN712_10350 [Gemmatimonadetes bacterium]|jgi:catechol 2,3-dioxygenase-like lactoylglutathione lyase family enzyme|nr:hypothetical protein [Gemmatimonadota bacterium]MBT6147624.1 hypothetical protein [Gemmatimonadota bacterium]MBT7860704.1 hypothetical protein [Gemmatimonadota bacterium]